MLNNAIIRGLFATTRTYEVIAIQSYGQNGAEIGIRRETYHDENLRDPVLGNTHFMICGDIYRVIPNLEMRKVLRTRDFMEIPMDKCIIKLRAVPCFDETIELGEYQVLSREVIDVDKIFGLANVVKLKLKRK